MSPPPDSKLPPPRQQMPCFWRAALLIAGTCAGSLLVAAPMILSEWDDSPSPAYMRIMIALIMALLLLPGVLPGFWQKPLWPALAGMVGPAFIAAIFASLMIDEDYSFMKIGVPVIIAGGMLMTLMLPSRRYLAGMGRCHLCGYDLRGAIERRCSECGTAVNEAAQVRMPRRFHLRWMLIGVAGFALSSILCFFFIQFLLSLG